MLASVRPRDLAGKTRRRLAAGLAGELEAIDNKARALDKELTGAGHRPAGVHPDGPARHRPPGAARLSADAAVVRQRRESHSCQSTSLYQVTCTACSPATASIIVSVSVLAGRPG